MLSNHSLGTCGPYLGHYELQYQLGTSDLEFVKRRKKEEESVNTTQMKMKDYFQKVEDLGNCINGKRKKNQSPTEKNKKQKLGNQTTV